MYKLIFLWIQLLCSFGIWAQENLVLNPSFEDTASMTYGVPYLITANWWNPNLSSADYCTPHCEELCCGSGNVNCAPYQVGLGYQEAQDGFAYIALDIYEYPENVTKEYAQGYLSEPLQTGESYCVSCWVAMVAESGLRSCDFQIAFTDQLIYGVNEAGSLNLPNQVPLDISAADSISWLYVENTYVAQGGELYIYLGSNTPNEDLTCVEEYSEGWIWNAAYMFVDNVKVIKSDSCVQSVMSHQSDCCRLYPNPTFSQVFVQIFNPEADQISIYNCTGMLVKTTLTEGTVSRIDISDLASGVYIVSVKNDDTDNRMLLMVRE
ncbi:MAG: hypothetical protein RL220_1838 [Bacteroidota bacterium]